VLRTNVATRPFYNERTIHLALGVVAALVLLVTLFNVGRMIALSARNTELGTQIRQDEERAAKLEADAKILRSRINQVELADVVAAAREANALIDQRTFSWTEFFNLIESTLPADVMLTSVRPDVREGQTHLSMTVLARRAEDIDAFMEALEATKAFVGILPVSERLTEEGLHEVDLSGRYVGSTGAAGP
jgi:Tfp pilus assembly protein PilN